MLARDFYPIELNSGAMHYIAMNGDHFVTLLRQRIESDPDITAAGLARAAGMDTSTLRKLISGENKSPKVATAEKVCRALGTTLDAFMGNDVDPVQHEIVSLYNQLSPSERRLLLAAAKGLAADNHEAT